MTTETREHTTAGLGTAVLTGDVGDDSDSFTIHGVAIGSGDVTVGSSGVRKIWPGEELQDAASSLVGKPLVKDHENSVDGVIGRVTDAVYEENTGVLYEAEISEQFEDIAQKIADGLLEVSVRAYHAPTEELEEDDETGAKRTEDIKFDNLAVVPQGAAPSNTAEAGESDAMSQSHPELSASELRAKFGHDGSDNESETEENRHGPAHMDGAPDWDEGDMVRWQVEPDLFGKVVHVDDEKDIVMVEIMGMENDSMTSTGFTITAGYSDLRPMRMPMGDAMPEDDEENSLTLDAYLSGRDELAEVNGLDINGLVMWDDGEEMGVISDFMTEDDDLMVEIDVMGRDDGSFETTGDTVTVPIHETDSTDEEMSDTEHTPLGEWSTEELAEMSWHTPEYDGGVDQEWSEPSLSEFLSAMDTDAESWDDLTEDQQSMVADHFFVSKSGFPPQNFGDLALPVVEVDGQLNLNALANAKARAGQVEGVSGDMLDSIEGKIDELANDNFEDADFGSDEEENTGRTDTTNDIRIAQLTDDSSEADKSGTSGAGTLSQNTENMKIDYKDVDADELEDGHVVVDQSQLDTVVEKAERADELDDRLDQMNSTLETLSEQTETLDEVDSDALDELAAADDPVVHESDEYEAKMEQVDEIGSIFAELLEEAGSPFDAEELTERFSPLELKAKYEEEYVEDDGSLVDQLGSGDPTPEGEDVESEELEDTSGSGSNEEPTKEEAREYVAQHFESEGYEKQAEEMRQGRIPVEDYVDYEFDE